VKTARRASNLIQDRIRETMSLQTYILFVGATLILCLVPGADMLFLRGRTIAQGRSASLCAAVTGLSALVLVSATAFTAVKWAGAAYLLYLGLGALRSRGSFALPVDDTKTKALRLIFWQGFLSDVLNPKVALLYVALLPQFISAHDSSPVTNLAVLGVTGNMVVIATSITYVFLAARMTGGLRRNQTIPPG
jgi:threonine/homoserine/homoserine lactone efflux protein